MVLVVVSTLSVKAVITVKMSTVVCTGLQKLMYERRDRVKWERTVCFILISHFSLTNVYMYVFSTLIFGIAH